jgi:cystathionine beta-synthase
VTGTGRYLKSKNPELVIVGADPEGSVLSGDTARPYLQEGIGEDFFPGTYDAAVVDRWVRVSDRDAFAMARRITREEGILAGESCGTAVVAALDEARRLMREEGDGARQRVMVVIFPDGGRNYLSKLYNDEWMRANGLLTTTGAVVRVDEVLRARHHGKDLPAVVLARTTDRVGAAIDLLQLYGISQLPVSERPDDDAIEGIIGSVSEKGLLDRAYRDPSVVERTVGEVMDPPLPTVDVGASVDDAFGLLSGGAPAVVATKGDRAGGVVTKLDLLEFLAHRRPRAD